MSRLGRPEILAPAGDEASLKAALAAGADAVYLGLDEGFNARARAGNFASAELGRVVELCHRAGTRVFLTLNTLIFEDELADAARSIEQAARAGVDALIVQDPAMALLARRIAPDLEVHASTQMTISSPEAARFAEALGVTRIVVPRELSLTEIERFMKGTDLEVEVFIHGALCVSWSGQCLTSEAWSGRSANRGQCAQSCRLPYHLILDGRRHDLGDVAYLLSPKDLAGVRALPRLMALGVHGLKIEGRQKGPAYVATATEAYRRWVDEASSSKASLNPGEARRRLEAMSLAFSRGFSDGFFQGSDHQTLVEGRFPKHRGLLLGRVVKVMGDDVLVERTPEGRPWTGALAADAQRAGPKGALASPIPESDGGLPLPTIATEPRPGQGVVFDQGNPEDLDEPGGPIFRVTSPEPNLHLLGFGRPGPDLTRVRPGDLCWITSDPAVAARGHPIRDDALPREAIPLDGRVAGRIGEPLRVTMTAPTGRTAEATSTSLLARARGRGLDEELLRAKLGAFGGSPFTLRHLDMKGLEKDLHLPVKELKALRRRLTENLSKEQADEKAARVHPWKVALEEMKASAPAPPGEKRSPLLVPLCRSMAQLEAVIAAGLTEVELDWMELVGLKRAHAMAKDAGLQVTLCTLRIQKPGEAGFASALEALAPDAVLVRHWGGLMEFRDRPADRRPVLHGDFSLNVTNSVTARHLLALGLETLTVSHDLDEERLMLLAREVDPSRLAVVVQHRIAAFHTEHCLYAHLLSEGRDHRSCGRPCEEHEISLENAKGKHHPVIVDAGCRNTVFNSELQTAAHKIETLAAAGFHRFRVEFLRETRDEAARALRAWQDLFGGRITPEELNERVGAQSRIGVIGTAH